jgi:hypothetical protein
MAHSQKMERWKLKMEAYGTMEKVWWVEGEGTFLNWTSKTQKKKVF